MNGEPEKKGCLRDRLFLLGAFLLPFCVIMITRIAMIRTTGEAGYDALYHAGIAKLGPGTIMAGEFPWLESSIWKTAFADKEMLYHLALWLIFRIQMLFGFAVEPPFFFASAFFLAFLCGSFVFAGVRFRVPPALLFVGSLFFALISPTWTYRVSMLRPHVVSAACFLLACGLLNGGTLKARIIKIGALSFLYSWTYSNPHFIVIPVLVFSLFSLGRDGVKSLLLPLVSLSAVLLGLLVHPQFPNSFKIWKIQSWDALLSPLLADHLISKPNEMLPPPFIWCMYVLPLFLMVYLTMVYLIRLTERKGWKNLSPALFSLAFLAWGFTAGIFLAMRSVEYAAPLTVLLFLVLLARAHEEGLLNPFRRAGVKTQLSLLFLIAILLGGPCMYKTVLDGRKSVTPVQAGVSMWMRENLKPGETIINLDWSDFPALFYAMPEFRYQWGMDPVFSLAAQPERTRLLNDTRSFLKIPPSASLMKRTFGCRFAVILFPRVQHAMYLHRNGWRYLSEIKSPDGKRTEGWVFDLDERAGAKRRADAVRLWREKKSSK